MELASITVNLSWTSLLCSWRLTPYDTLFPVSLKTGGRRVKVLDMITHFNCFVFHLFIHIFKKSALTVLLLTRIGCIAYMGIASLCPLSIVLKEGKVGSITSI